MNFFNQEILDIIKAKKLPKDNTLSYLVSLYYELNCEYFPEDFQSKILSLGIIDYDYKNSSVIWLIPLFGETETGFEWIKDWMDLFKSVNPERRGVKSEVLSRMKEFFKSNPSVRKEQVIKATKNYISTIKDNRYIMMSHKFIKCKVHGSLLAKYVEELSEEEDYNDSNIL